ncbi:MAG: hypothetical protein GY696_02205 [Gammaproteobacteria bacterium]|nr:hypothetical protein [Gammaproteobacteria bacterium]
MHPDFQNPVATLVNYTQPRFRVTRRTIPRLVLAIENSIEMDARGQWEYIRTAAKKFILHDLPENIELGLVLFNTDAYIAHPVTKLGASMVSPIRNSLAFSINNRHNLSPKSELSCVRCAVNTALEALLMTSSKGDAAYNGNAVSSSDGGVVIVITRDDLASHQFEASTEASLESDLLKTAMKHNLRVYPIVLPLSDFSKGYPALERVAAQTRGSSFLLSDRLAAGAGGLAAQVDGKVGYGSVYMDLVEALRVVQTQTIQYSPQLVRFQYSKLIL